MASTALEKVSRSKTFNFKVKSAILYKKKIPVTNLLSVMLICTYTDFLLKSLGKY